MARSTFSAASYAPPTCVEQIPIDWAGCRRCPLLVAHREQLDQRHRRSCAGKIAFGEGNPGADIMIIARAPGPEEDVVGRPQVGVAGQMLDWLLEQAGLHRTEVWLSNLVLCMPPDNRVPTDFEVGNCWPRLMAEMYLVDPLVIIAAGAEPAAALLQRNVTSITRIQGQVFSARFPGRRYDIPRTVIPMFQPAYVSKNPGLHQQSAPHRSIQALQTAARIVRAVREKRGEELR